MRTGAGKRIFLVLLVALMCFAAAPAVFAAQRGMDLSDGLAVWYKFDETDGNIAKDSSGNRLDAAVYGGAAWITTEAGEGVALRLDNTSGAGQYVEIPPQVMSNVRGDFTVSLWVKVNGTSGYSRIFDCGTSSSSVMYLTSGQYVFKMDASGSKRLSPPANLHKKGRDGFAAGYLYPEEYAEPRWEHLTITRRGTDTSLWIDGIRWARGDFGTTVPRTGANYKFYLGKSNWDADPLASLEFKDFRIYDRALSIAEILAVMEDGEWSDGVQVRHAIDCVDLGDLSGVTENLFLPTLVNGKVAVAWASDDPAVLKVDESIGAVRRPAAGAGSAHVRLTATFSHGGCEVNKTYDVTVLPKAAGDVAYTLTVDGGKVVHALSPTMYGAFFEDINHAGDGGLYPELLRNTCFHDSASSIPYWYLTTAGGADGEMSLDKTDNLGEAQFQHLKLDIRSMPSGGAVGLCNEGYSGMEFESGKAYTLSFYARTEDFAGALSAVLCSATGEEISAPVAAPRLSSAWTKYTLTLTPNEYAAQGELALLCTGGTGSICFDVLSLTPAAGYGTLGLRTDMAEMLEGMNPTFLRFPGGCYIEGTDLSQSFYWKTTVGKREMRAGHDNIWGYRVTDGLGIYEFFRLCEELGCEPLYVCGVGIAHNETTADWNFWIRDTLDAIEFANGDPTTTWGRVRAEMGHPEPFGLKYIEIGNEANLSGKLPDYKARYQDFYDAIKTLYPYMHLIADAHMEDRTVDAVDLHYYDTPTWFGGSGYLFDGYGAAGYDVYVGEYAVATEQGLQNLDAALGEAAFMLGMERNSDVVKMASYAPIFNNPRLQRWTSGAVFFDNSRLFATPSYHVQAMLSKYIGDDILASTLSASDGSFDGAQLITGGVGLCTWNTNVTFSDIRVTSNADGSLLFDGDTAPASAWTRGKGAWTVDGGRLTQTQIATDCRIWLDGRDWSDYTYEVTARKNSGSEAFILLVGHRDANNLYMINIGGWSNAKSAIQRMENGVKSTATNVVAGAFETGRDYKIRAVVSENRITVYVDDNLLFAYRKNDIPGCPLQYVVEKDNATGDIFIKAVNRTDGDFTATVTLTGITGVGSTAQAHILTAASKDQENSFSYPDTVSPVTALVTGGGNSFEYTFMKNAVTVLVIPTGDAAANKSELQKAVAAEAAEDFGDRRFTKRTWAAYAAALSEAEAVLQDGNATQADVNAALRALSGAKALLQTQKGDMDGDGRITLLDVLSLLRSVVNGQAHADGDLNGDGKFSLFDVYYLMKLVAD